MRATDIVYQEMGARGNGVDVFPRRYGRGPKPEPPSIGLFLLYRHARWKRIAAVQSRPKPSRLATAVAIIDAVAATEVVESSYLYRLTGPIFSSQLLNWNSWGKLVFNSQGDCSDRPIR